MKSGFWEDWISVQRASGAEEDEEVEEEDMSIFRLNHSYQSVMRIGNESGVKTRC